MCLYMWGRWMCEAGYKYIYTYTCTWTLPTCAGMLIHGLILKIGTLLHALIYVCVCVCVYVLCVYTYRPLSFREAVPLNVPSALAVVGATGGAAPMHRSWT